MKRREVAQGTMFSPPHQSGSHGMHPSNLATIKRPMPVSSVQQKTKMPIPLNREEAKSRDSEKHGIKKTSIKETATLHRNKEGTPLSPNSNSHMSSAPSIPPAKVYTYPHPIIQDTHSPYENTHMSYNNIYSNAQRLPINTQRKANSGDTDTANINGSHFKNSINHNGNMQQPIASIQHSIKTSPNVPRLSTQSGHLAQNKSPSSHPSNVKSPNKGPVNNNNNNNNPNHNGKQNANTNTNSMKKIGHAGNSAQTAMPLPLKSYSGHIGCGSAKREGNIGINTVDKDKQQWSNPAALHCPGKQVTISTNKSPPSSSANQALLPHPMSQRISSLSNGSQGQPMPPKSINQGGRLDSRKLSFGSSSSRRSYSNEDEIFEGIGQRGNSIVLEDTELSSDVRSECSGDSTVTNKIKAKFRDQISPKKLDQLAIIKEIEVSQSAHLNVNSQQPFLNRVITVTEPIVNNAQKQANKDNSQSKVSLKESIRKLHGLLDGFNANGSAKNIPSETNTNNYQTTNSNGQPNINMNHYNNGPNSFYPPKGGIPLSPRMPPMNIAQNPNIINNNNIVIISHQNNSHPEDRQKTKSFSHNSSNSSNFNDASPINSSVPNYTNRNISQIIDYSNQSSAKKIYHGCKHYIKLQKPINGCEHQAQLIKNNRFATQRKDRDVPIQHKTLKTERSASSNTSNLNNAFNQQLTTTTVPSLVIPSIQLPSSSPHLQSVITELTHQMTLARLYLEHLKESSKQKLEYYQATIKAMEGQRKGLMLIIQGMGEKMDARNSFRDKVTKKDDEDYFQGSASGHNSAISVNNSGCHGFSFNSNNNSPNSLNSFNSSNNPNSPPTPNISYPHSPNNILHLQSQLLTKQLEITRLHRNLSLCHTAQERHLQLVHLYETKLERMRQDINKRDQIILGFGKKPDGWQDERSRDTTQHGKNALFNSPRSHQFQDDRKQSPYIHRDNSSSSSHKNQKANLFGTGSGTTYTHILSMNKSNATQKKNPVPTNSNNCHNG